MKFGLGKAILILVALVGVVVVVVWNAWVDKKPSLLSGLRLGKRISRLFGEFKKSIKVMSISKG